MRRRTFLQVAVLASASLAGCRTSRSLSKSIANTSLQRKTFALEEATIMQLQTAMKTGQFTAVSLTRKYLERIEQFDQRGPALRAILELNPDALALARELDRERQAKGPRGPLHGIPVLIKDNIDTHDRMMCTAGSLALLGSYPAQDAFLVQKLRQAGAVILGKTNLSEWANFRSSRSTSGWSGRGGLTRNPYVLDRNPSGSSSGSAVAVAANLCAVAVGTETNGSILSPSSYNGIVGLKPTVGLISRSGIIPIAHSQDTAGPMARTVTDAAILLGCLAGRDERDPATQAAQPKTDYTQTLDAQALKGARIGVARKFFRTQSQAEKLVETALAEIKRQGATLIDPTELPSFAKLGNNSYELMLYEFKSDLNAYLKALAPNVPVHSLKELIEFNERQRDQEMPWFAQEIFLQAEAKGPLSDKPYQDALAACQRLSRQEGIDAVMDEHRLDAIIAPTTGPAHVTDLLYGDRGAGSSTTPAAVAGYPSITVPAGCVADLPVGLSFFGRAWSEPKLLSLAFAFEQATQHRRAPRFKMTMEI